MYVWVCEFVIGVFGFGDFVMYGFEIIVFDKVYGSVGVIVFCQVRIDGGFYMGVIVFFVDYFQWIFYLQVGFFIYLGCQFFIVDQVCGMFYGFFCIFFGEFCIGKMDMDGQVEYQ